MNETIVVLGGNRVVRDKLESAATARGATIVVTMSLDEPHLPEADAVVVDLSFAGTEAADEARRRWPSALIAAFMVLPERERWQEATTRFDLVATRGTIATRLAAALDAWTGPATAARVPLFEAADATGRLGVVHRAETQAGPVAVYSAARSLFACADVCPHAGGRLSEGPFAGTVVTCPLHGSQFDVRDGSRVRGPADEPIRTFPVVVDGGTVSMEIDA